MNKDIYDDHMDREIVSLCDALNSLPGVHTSESCGGHGIHQAEVFFFCTSLKSLAKIQRAVDCRYGGQKNRWLIGCSTTDTPEYGTTLVFSLESEAPYQTKAGKRHEYEPAFYYDTDMIIQNLKLYNSKWGDDICLKAKCRDCPKKLGKAFAKATEEMEKRYEKAMVFWRRTHGYRASKKARR